jgi:hypothetical protein
LQSQTLKASIEGMPNGNEKALNSRFIEDEKSPIKRLHGSQPMTIGLLRLLKKQVST